MIRLLSVALILASLAAPAGGQKGAKPNQWRIVDPPSKIAPSIRQSGADVGANGRIGLGMFGIKDERSLPSATVREITTPKSRRPGIGFSLKF